MQIQNSRYAAGGLDSFAARTCDAFVSEPPSRAHHLVPLITLQVFGLACGLAGVRWSSALVPPETLGTFGILVSTQGFAMMATHLGLMQHVQRHWTLQTANRDYLQVLLAAAARPTLLLAAALTVIWVALHFAEPTISSGWWPWMLAVNLLAVAAQIAHSALQAEERYWAHAVVSMISSAARSFLPLLFVAGGTATVVRLGLGFLGSALLWAAAGLFFLRMAFRRRQAPGGAPIASPGHMMGTFMLVGLLGWTGSSAHRFFAAGVLDPVTTGYFMLAANLTAVVPTMVGVVGYSYTFPPLYQAARHGLPATELLRRTRNSVVGVMLLGQAGLLALHWVGPHLVGIVLNARYGASTGWILATGGAVLASVSAGFFCNLLIAENRERVCLRLMLLSAGFRLTVIALLSFSGNLGWLQAGLSLLPWPTVLLEYAFVLRAHRNDGRLQP